jgi:hypothetical protein
MYGLEVTEVGLRGKRNQCLVHKPDGVFDVFFVQHFYGGVHVTQRYGNEYAGAAIVGIGKAVCIGTGAAAYGA